MSDVRLGRLSRVTDIREIWRHERYGFSAWLLANSDTLADVLGIDLELERAEEPVGDFSLDLIGRDRTNGAVLMVENQLERTDHWHLGQVVLYAAGTGAGTIVWIARDFRPEHRQALNWLNESTGEEFHFFGVQLEAVSIDGSAPAPLLTAVVEPSDWQKRIRKKADASALGGKGKHYAMFWSRFIERVNEEHPGWTRRRPAEHTQNWLDMPSPIRGSYLAASFARGRRLRHEVYIGGGDQERNLAVFRALEAERARLEAVYGRPLAFEELPQRTACRIAEYREESDVSDEERHEEFIDWFFDCGERLRRALQEVGVVE